LRGEKGILRNERRKKRDNKVKHFMGEGGGGLKVLVTE